MGEIRIDWKKWEKRNRITFWDRIRLLFVRPQFAWDHATQDEPGIVTKYKVLGDRTFILAQEPMAYGDARNAQISRFS